MKMSLGNFAPVGWRARIGIITPAVGLAIISDFHKIAPEGVAMVLTPVAEPLTQDTVDQLSRVGDYVAEAAKKFIVPKVNVILWNTTTGSLMKGYGYDLELIKRIEEATNISATTSSTAMIAAFKKLGIKKLCLAMPYVDEVNEREKRFLEDNGFEVLRYKGLQLLDIGDIINVAPYRMYQLAKEVDLAEADAVFISCAGLSTLDIIQMLEDDLGKPVLSTNQVGIWRALQIAKIREPIQGYGRLLREP
jgi:maleate isomerase